MSARSDADKILHELKFNFAAFSMGGFLRFVGDARGRNILTIPWQHMPATLFGAWITDAEEPLEYIFFRDDVSVTLQIHIQLHELSHFLCGHPTLSIDQQFITDVLNGNATLPFAELPQLRSPKRANDEVQAETLANLIQERAIQNSQLDRLLYDTTPDENLAKFLRKISL